MSNAWWSWASATSFAHLLRILSALVHNITWTPRPTFSSTCWPGGGCECLQSRLVSNSNGYKLISYVELCLKRNTRGEATFFTYRNVILPSTSAMTTSHCLPKNGIYMGSWETVHYLHDQHSREPSSLCKWCRSKLWLWGASIPILAYWRSIGTMC